MDTIEWTGPVGDAWASEWHRTDRSFSGLDPALNRHLLDHLPERADRIVDIGCGAGSTAIAIAQARPQTRVIGIDLSAALLDVARSRGNAVANLDFRHGSAERAVAELAPVDGYISRHGVMFFGDPVAAFTALRASAAPGAPLLFSCFRSIASNPWASELAAASSGGAAPVTDSTDPGPFAFADAEYVERILTAAGWRPTSPRAIDYVYHAGAGPDPVGDAFSFFARIGPAARLLRVASEADRPAMAERVRSLLERHRTGDTIDFPAAAWLWYAIAA